MVGGGAEVPGGRRCEELPTADTTTLNWGQEVVKVPAEECTMLELLERSAQADGGMKRKGVFGNKGRGGEERKSSWNKGGGHPPVRCGCPVTS